MLERGAGIRHPAPKGAAAGTKQLSAKTGGQFAGRANQLPKEKREGSYVYLNSHQHRRFRDVDRINPDF